MALKNTPEKEISHYGCATGMWEVRRNAPAYRRLTIASVVEKPTLEFARANLAVR
jgi:UTP-glucose-1-phosphate uridylyltransferase